MLYPGKIAHSKSANHELFNDVRFVEVGRREVTLHTSSHLTPIEAWRRAVSTTSSEARLENCTQLFGVRQIWRAWNSRLRKSSTSHLFWLVQTCPNLSKPVHNTVPCTLVSLCNFLHFRRLLIFSLTSYPAEIAYFSSPYRELSNGGTACVGIMK